MRTSRAIKTLIEDAGCAFYACFCVGLTILVIIITLLVIAFGD